MAKKASKQTKAKKAKTPAKKAKKAMVARSNNRASGAAIAPGSFELAANHPEKRYPGNDDIHDILCRWIDGRGTVCKQVPKGGSWDDA